MIKQKSKKLLKYDIKNKRLFLNYAMPCLVERIRRGEFKLEEFEKLCEDLIEGREIPDEEMYNLFPVAMSFIEDSAKKLDKIKDNVLALDNDVIHQYFWYDHDSVVKSRMNPERRDYCFVLPAKVKKIFGKEGIVETPKGERRVSLAFLNNNDLLNKHITIHYYHACEIISEEDFNKLWGMKNE